MSITYFFMVAGGAVPDAVALAGAGAGLTAFGINIIPDLEPDNITVLGGGVAVVDGPTVIGGTPIDFGGAVVDGPTVIGGSTINFGSPGAGSPEPCLIKSALFEDGKTIVDAGFAGTISPVSVPLLEDGSTTAASLDFAGAGVTWVVIGGGTPPSAAWIWICDECVT